MKVKSMRRLDRWAGVPMSAILTVVRKIGSLVRSPYKEPPRRILFVKLVEQGATVLAEPALRRAVKMVGRDNVFMAVFDENRFILDALNIIPPGNVITIRSSSLFACGIDTLRAIRRMRREKIDTAVDFEFFSRFSAALTYLSGARRRVGFHSFAGEAGYRGDLMTHRVAFNPALHATQTYQALVAAISLRPEQLPAMNTKPSDDQVWARVEVESEELHAVEAMLGRVLGRQAVSPLILFNANSGDLLPLRRWAANRYVQLAQRLLQQYPDITIAFTGSPEERSEADLLVRQVGSERCVSVAGETTLRQLLVLYDFADVLVTNDSGPAHFASLTSIDVVALFGPETPAVFGSRSPRSHIVWTGLACSPCVNAFNQRVTTCKTNFCMQRISVDEVFDVVCRAFEGRHEVIRLGSAASA